MALRVAVLVDGDNLGAARGEEVLALAARQGAVDLARVYLDAQRGSGWHEQAGFRLQHAGTGKNASDLLMAIEAMELALREGFDCFVLATSDGDFSHLARRLRKLGVQVMVAGEAKTPLALREAGHSFHEMAPVNPPPCPAPGKSQGASPGGTSLDGLVRRVIAANSKNGAGMSIARLGQVMYEKHAVSASSLPEGNWRSYFAARPDLYDADTPGPEAKVRFKREGFGLPRPLAAE
ncbi:NYN domain-containing protein [Cribrihabitans sp. XS_ASV171]